MINLNIAPELRDAINALCADSRPEYDDNAASEASHQTSLMWAGEGFYSTYPGAYASLYETAEELAWDAYQTVLSDGLNGLDVCFYGECEGAWE